MLILLFAAILQAWITNIAVNTYGYVYAVKNSTLITLYPNGTQVIHEFPQTITALCLLNHKVILGTQGGVWIDHKFVKVGTGWVMGCEDDTYARALCCPPRSFVGNVTLNDTIVGLTNRYILTWSGKILSINGRLLKTLEGYITSYDTCKDKLAVATCCPDKVYVFEIPSLKPFLKLDTFATKVKFIYCNYLATASRAYGIRIYYLNGTPISQIDVDTFTFNTWGDRLFAGLNKLKQYSIDIPAVKCMAIRTYTNAIAKILEKRTWNVRALPFVEELERWLTSFNERLERFKELVYSKPSFTYILDVNYASLILGDMIKELNDYMLTLNKVCSSCYKTISPYYNYLKNSASQCISYLSKYAQKRWQEVSSTLKIKKPLVKYLVSSNVTCVGNEVVIGLVIENEPTNPPLMCNVGGETFSIQPGLAITKTLIVTVSKEGINVVKIPVTCSFLDKKVEELIVIKIAGKKCR